MCVKELNRCQRNALTRRDVNALSKFKHCACHMKFHGQRPVCVYVCICVYGGGGDNEVDSTISYNSSNHLPFPIHLLLFTHY